MNSSGEKRPEARDEPRCDQRFVRRLRAHIALMAPHQKDRVGGKLIVESCETIETLQEYIETLEKWRDETVANCSVASDPPYSPNVESTHANPKTK